MTYAKYISKDKVEYPDYSAYPFKGIPNVNSNDRIHRIYGYLPMAGQHTPPEGYEAVPVEFTLINKTETHKEWRDRDPVTGEQFIVKDYDEEGHEIGEHVEWREVEITTDISYIQIEKWNDIPIPPPAPIRKCTKYELVTCLQNFYPALLETFRVAYSANSDLQFYWNSVIELDRDNEDFKTAVALLGITEEQLDEIFSKIIPITAQEEK